MLQTLKKTPRWLATAAKKPHQVIATLRYRVLGWTLPPAPTPHDHVLDAVAREDDTFRHLSFTFAIIALSARIATADGPLTRDKYIAFRESFPLKGGICAKIRSLFVLACGNDTPFEHYVSQIKYMYPGRADLFTAVMERLFRIATADGQLERKAEFMLADIAHGLELPPAAFSEIREEYCGPHYAHLVLGVRAREKPSVLKKRYHELMRRYHPDRYATEELSPEVRMLLRAKTSEINDAYKLLIKRTREHA